MFTNPPPLHEPNLLIEIESFTKKVVNEGLKKNDFPEYIRLLNDLEKIYSCNHRYTGYVRLFDHIAREDLQCFKRLQNGQYTYESFAQSSDWLHELTSWMFVVHKPNVLRDLKAYKHGLGKRQKKLQQRIEALFWKYSRNLVVRVDLKYRIDSQHLVDIETFERHVKTLCNRMANKDTCFNNLRFNTWCLEQAPKGGYHIHLLLIYDGSASTYDCKLAKWVGEVWMNEITDGLGYYWNCHTSKSAKDDRDEARTEPEIPIHNSKYLNGLGMIHRDDPRGLDKLRAVYGYFHCTDERKLDQQLRVRMKGMRMFGYSYA